MPFSLISPTPIEWSYPQSGMLLSMGIALSATSSGVNIFGHPLKKLIYWKEFQNNYSSWAYYCGIWISILPRILLGSLHFTAISIYMNSFYIHYNEYFFISSLLGMVWYSWAILLSFLFPFSEASLFSIVGGLIFCIGSGLIEAIPYSMKVLSPAFWFSEGLYTAGTKYFLSFMEVKEISAPLWNYSIERYELDYWIIFLMWLIYFGLGYLAMKREYWKKYK